MSVEVHKEPSEKNCWPKENCCVCRTPTSYWYGTGPLNVALCPTCATRATADSLPTKAQWIDAERGGQILPNASHRIRQSRKASAPQRGA
jgi:hypothetical protein